MDDKNIDFDLERLRDMDLAEVARSTRIEQENLKAIVDKDFEKLSNFNVRGYVKILERELGLDLSAWLSEFESAKSSFAPTKKVRVEKVYARSVGGHRESGGWIIWLIITALIIGAIFYFGLHTSFNSLIGGLFVSDNNSSYSNVSIVSDTQKQLEDIGIKTVTQSANAQIETNVSIDANLSSLNALDRSIQLSLAEANASEANATDMNATDINASIQSALTNEIKITPHGKLWLGIINLSNGQKREFVTNDTYSMSVEDELLIATGHGMLELDKPDGKVDYNEKSTLKFHVKDGVVSKISNDEFVKLNKGKKW